MQHRIGGFAIPNLGLSLFAFATYVANGKTVAENHLIDHSFTPSLLGFSPC
ncbi:hypothetical protein [Vibrio sp. HB161653]|uniref:hypothetical protein n=1 Tax=Vibrio sp. HB161653 TaxID=3068274 RepID=UPI00273D553F|nr:hypothetical protein [Vibrio sp. HB161653]